MSPSDDPTKRDHVRILLADDHAVVRGGVRMLLEDQPDFEVVGEAEDGVEAVALAERLNPDVVLMDISMPKINGIAATTFHDVDPRGQVGQPGVGRILRLYDGDVTAHLRRYHERTFFAFERLDPVKGLQRGLNSLIDTDLPLRRHR